MLFYLFQMRTVVIGNSIVRGLLNPEWETVSLRGADWYDIITYVFNNSERFENSIIYIHIGPVRFSKLVGRSGRTECHLRSRRTLSNVGSIFRDWLRYLTPLRIYPVICTVYPMCFKRYNRHRGVHTNNRRNFFSSLTRKIRGMTCIENRDIVDFNVSNEMVTPYLHRKVFTRRRGRYVFRDDFLTDGLHPDPRLIEDWKFEITRANDINQEALSDRRRQDRRRSI